MSTTKRRPLATWALAAFTASCVRPIPISQQVFSDARPVLDQIRLQVRDRHLVDAGRPLVADHAGIGPHHVLAADDQLHQPHLRLRVGVVQSCRDV